MAVVFIQDGAPAFISEGAGDDRYIVSALVAPNQVVTITDGEGTNTLQLEPGIEITSSSTNSNFMTLNLSNGATINITNADNFIFVTGPTNSVDPATGTSETFSEFVTNSLGLSEVPTGDAQVEGPAIEVLPGGGTDAGGDDLPAALPTVSLAPTNSQTTEGDSSNTVVTFTATLSSASDELVAVDYATSSSSAQSGVDFLAASGSLVFSPGTTQRTFDVEIVGDTVFEADEIFRVALSNPQGAALDQSGSVIKGFEALHTIQNDDSPSVGLGIDYYSDTREDTIDAEEYALYQMIMEYRASLGLSEIPLSNALTITASRHVLDTVYNLGGYDGHNWSDAPYVANDPSTYPNIWFAPERIGTGYTDAGFEISTGYLGNPFEVPDMTADAALISWQNSAPHNDVITQQGPWSQDFLAIGVAIHESVSHVWFGREVDPTGAPAFELGVGLDYMSIV